MSNQSQAPAAAPEAASPEQQINEAEKVIEATDASDESTEASAAVEEQKRFGKKLIKLKVDGKEIEEEMDLDNEDYLRRQLQLAKTGQKRMQEAAQLKKEHDSLLKLLQEQPDSVLSKMGIDPERFAVELLERKIAEAQKSPEQKAREAEMRELEELRRREQDLKNRMEQMEMSQLQAEQERVLEEGVLNGLQSQALPASPATVKRMAEVMRLAIQRDIDLSPEDAAAIVKRELVQDLRKHAELLADDDLEEFISKERFAAMQTKKIAAAKAVAKKMQETPSAIKSTGESEMKKVNSKGEPEQKPKIHVGDWLYRGVKR